MDHFNNLIKVNEGITPSIFNKYEKGYVANLVIQSASRKFWLGISMLSVITGAVFFEGLIICFTLLIQVTI